MHTDDYTERLWVPLSWWLLGLLFAIAVGWAFYVASTPAIAGVATLVAAAVVVLTLARYGAADIAVSESGLRAGRAVLPWSSIGVVEPLDQEATRRAIGVEADATAYLFLRAYCRGSVLVRLDDAVDPTPYWLVSTRRPDELARRLRRGDVRD